MKNKKLQSITEQVGDTSVYSDEPVNFDKKRKIKVYASLGAFVLLIVISILLFTTPTKVEFIYQDSATQTVHYIVDKSTKNLTDGPKDPTRPNYNFDGWYYDKNCSKGGLFNNKDNDSLLKETFKTTGKTTLFAKWTPIEYEVTYVVKGTGEFMANINDQRVQALEELNATLNPSTYCIKHSITEAERLAYVEKLRKENPDKYVNGSNAQNEVTAALELFSNESQKSSVNLKSIPENTISGWTFLGWYDNPNYEGNPVTSLDKVNPKEITLYAKWSH